MAVAMQPPTRISLQEILDNPNGTPQIDLAWEPFNNKISSFLTAIDVYALSARRNIAGFSSDHINDIKELKAGKEDLEAQIAGEREREGEMLATLEQERHTMQSLSSSLSQLQNSLAKVREESSQLESELQAIRAEVTSERAEKERQGRTLGSMKSRDQQELETLQDAIGWRVEGVGQDQLLMRFTLIDPADPTREFSILIDISKQEYSIPKVSPHLPQLSEMLSDLNEDRDFTGFIKRVRKGFKALCTPNDSVSRLDFLSGVTRSSAATPASTQTGRKEARAEVDDALEALTLDPK